ncbi:MAG TPA: M48 family metallopeptidase [Planctomycetota bacterium]|nr:M48 family metallopeptidase [Planctomycetota bacterium]
MWEAIQSNKRRSILLVSLMAALLVGLGFAIGGFIDPRRGPIGGVLGALAVWGILWWVALLQGDQILLATAGATRIEHDQAPLLFNVVDEMRIASGLEAMPEVYVMEDEVPNAFAVGRPPRRCAVAVTTGLLRLLDRDELQGVIGHEIGHLKNRDTVFMMLVGIMLGAIVLISDFFIRVRWAPRRRSRDDDSGGAQVIFMVVSILLVLLAPVLAQMIYFACSRRREYLADASSARFTRYPEGLASALEKLQVSQVRRAEVNRVLAPMYIVSPVAVASAIGLYSTHPPTQDRVRILRGMAGGAAFTDYEAAYQKIVGRGACIGQRTLAGEGAVDLRKAGPEGRSKEETVRRSREVSRMIGRLGNLIQMTCPCGVGIKVPPGASFETITCPRCGRENPVPKAGPTGIPQDAPAPSLPAPEAMRYERRESGSWESFRCACGHAIQLAPSFSAPHLQCPACGRTIEIA